MLGAAVVGGVILGLIEGVSLGISRVSGQMMLNEQSNTYILYHYISSFIHLICKVAAAQQQQQESRP